MLFETVSPACQTCLIVVLFNSKDNHLTIGIFCRYVETRKLRVPGCVDGL